MTKNFYRTTDEKHLFEEVSCAKEKFPVTTRIEIDERVYEQTIDGFGASFTDSAAFLIDKKLSSQQKEEAMIQLFDPEDGIGLSLVRNPMGASDYARFIYSYDDQFEGQKDPELNNFSIAHDKESILPLTKWAQKLNPELKLFASPWSPPGWMKDTGKMVTGRLLPEYYETYADYFVRFIQDYAEEGLKVYAVTPQNEPLFEPHHYPGMLFLAHEEAKFVREYLKPAFQKAGLETKIFGYDHNWDRVDYAFELYDQAEDAFDGIAWHWYGGNPVNQSRVASFFPEKEVHFTEGSGGEWIPAFEPAFSNLIRTGIEVLRNGSKSFILWNMALDENNGPVVPGFGRSTCRGLLKVNQKDQTMEYTLDYYGLAHFSKFIRPGAKRVKTEQLQPVKNVVFENRDGSLVWVVFNDSTEAQTIELMEQGKIIGKIHLLPKAAGTFVQKE